MKWNDLPEWTDYILLYFLTALVTISPALFLMAVLGKIYLWYIPVIIHAIYFSAKCYFDPLQ
jgi:hypothetical protein